MQSAICHWPEIPDFPARGQPVLLRVRASAGRAPARQELRTVLRQVLATWSGLAPQQLPLRETSRGPLWEARLHGLSLDVSLSYADSEGWIALLRGGAIGLDVMDLKPVPEWQAVARSYFGPAVQVQLEQSQHPVRDFAVAWTQLEARCKCLKRGLTEWSEASALAFAGCAVQSLVIEERLVVTVATAPGESP